MTTTTALPALTPANLVAVLAAAHPDGLLTSELPHRFAGMPTLKEIRRFAAQHGVALAEHRRGMKSTVALGALTNANIATGEQQQQQQHSCAVATSAVASAELAAVKRQVFALAIQAEGCESEARNLRLRLHELLRRPCFAEDDLTSSASPAALTKA